VIKKNVVIYVCLSYISVEPTQKKQYVYEIPCASSHDYELYFRWNRCNSGHRFIHFSHTPDCIAREIKVKSTHPRSEEDTKPLGGGGGVLKGSKKKKKGGGGGEKSSKKQFF